MTFTLENIQDSLAGVLKARYQYPVYLSPNQQGTGFPCFFIFYMPSTIEKQPGGRYYRDLGVDVVFLQQRNIVNGNAELLEIAGYLDETLELFNYKDAAGHTAKIRTYEREWKTEDGELHYQFHIRQRVSISKTSNPMQELEGNNASIKETGGKEAAK